MIVSDDTASERSTLAEENFRRTVGDRACQYWCVKFYTFFVESDMAIKKSCHFFWCNHIIQQQFKGEFLV